MPTKYPRVNVVLDGPLYEGLSRRAKREGISLSLKVTGLVKGAWRSKRIALGQIAEKSEQSLDRKKALTDQQVWSHLPQRRRPI